MKYDYLTPQEREQARDRRRLAVAVDLKALEAEHYERELDYRTAARENPPDDTAMAQARAAQQDLDARYAAAVKNLDATKG